MAERTGQVDPRLVVRWPPEAAGLWRCLLDMSRPLSMGGCAPMPQHEIEAWQRNHGVRFTAWELEMIEHMDAVVVSWHAERAAAKEKRRASRTA